MASSVRQPIQFFLKADVPTDLGIKGIASGPDLGALLTSLDLTIVEREWPTVVGKSGSDHNNTLGSLYDTSKYPTIVYARTDFKTYSTVTNTSRQRELSPAIYERMRVSAVGVVVESSDGDVLIHRRPRNATHVPDKIDSSVAGLCSYDAKGEIDFSSKILEKLSRELRVEKEEIEHLGLTGIHSSYEPDFSGAVDVAAKVGVTFDELEKRANRKYMQDIYRVPTNELPEFIYKHFVVDKDMVPDGCATLLACLPKRIFDETVARINNGQKHIVFGELVDGVFVEASQIGPKPTH